MEEIGHRSQNCDLCEGVGVEVKILDVFEPVDVGEESFKFLFG